MKLPTIAVMVQTEYHPATENRGSYVSARHLTSGKRRVFSWDHGCGIEENHMMAAQIVLPPGWVFTSMCSVKGGAYIFAASVVDAVPIKTTEQRRSIAESLAKKLEAYQFRDEHGHPLKDCVDFIDLVDLARGHD